MKNNIINFINCKILNNHKWTSAAQEGKRPEPIPKYASYSEIEANFKSYCKMYCKHCDHESDLNNW